jgi:hypothetical protein
MKALLLIVFASLVLQEVPLKSKEEFEFRVHLQFKHRQSPPVSEIHFTENQKQDNSTPLPYLTAQLDVLTIRDDEAKVKVVNNLKQTLMTKNLQRDSSLMLDLGFTDDLKDHTIPHEYSILFYSRERKVVRQIIVLFEENGFYFVNGEKRGKL